MEEKKYSLTNETIKYYQVTLHRIVAERDFGDVKRGQLGGFIESEANLSHEGDCWVADNAKGLENAIVEDNARVEGEAVMKGGTVIGFAKVGEKARLFACAWVSDNAVVYILFLAIR